MHLGLIGCTPIRATAAAYFGVTLTPVSLTLWTCNYPLAHMLPNCDGHNIIPLVGVRLTGKACMQALYHYATTIVVSMMHGMVKAGVDGSNYFWLLKASAQQMALRIYHAEEIHCLDADQFLVTGEAISIYTVRVQPPHLQ